MARILITWEIGENYGHVLPLLPLARSLKARGHEVIFALRDVLLVGNQFAADGFRVLQAPFHPDGPVPQGAPQPSNAAEILSLFGFSKPPVLAALVSAWRSLYALINPALVIGSYAPTSMLAARVDGIPRVLMALGFELPPASAPMPSLRPWLPIPAERHTQAARRVVAAVNAVLAPANIAVTDFEDIFSADLTFLNTWAELDHYGTRAGTRYSGPLYNTATGANAVWPPFAGARPLHLFAYLQPRMQGFGAILKALVGSPYHCLIAAPGISAAQMRENASPGMEIVPGPVRLDQALAECEVVVSYAGHGMVAATFAAGRPMLLLPQNLEQFLLARRLEEQGVAVLLQKIEKDALAEALGRLAGSTAFAERARQLASRFAGYDPERRSIEIAAEIDGFLARRVQASTGT
jgi:UDP:flavonoid glycosyltransferase YjiC (YdhE family)